MKFKILILSSSLERARRLLCQFVNRDNVRYEDYSHNDPYMHARHTGRLTLKDGTLLVARSVTQGIDRFAGLCCNQVFSEVSKSEIPTELLAYIELDLMKSEIPQEFQWQYLCPDYLLCYKCKCCTQRNECSELKSSRYRRLSYK